MLSNFLRSFKRSSRRQRPSRRSISSISSRSSTASISSSTASDPSITKPSKHFCRTGRINKKKGEQYIQDVHTTSNCEKYYPGYRRGGKSRKNNKTFRKNKSFRKMT